MINTVKNKLANLPKPKTIIGYIGYAIAGICIIANLHIILLAIGAFTVCMLVVGLMPDSQGE